MTLGGAQAVPRCRSRFPRTHPILGLAPDIRNCWSAWASQLLCVHLQQQQWNLVLYGVRPCSRPPCAVAGTAGQTWFSIAPQNQNEVV